MPHHLDLLFFFIVLERIIIMHGFNSPVHLHISCMMVGTSNFQSIPATPLIFKPPPPVGAGGGYMFSGRPSVRASVIHVVVLCFRDISSIC